MNPPTHTPPFYGKLAGGGVRTTQLLRNSSFPFLALERGDGGLEWFGKLLAAELRRRLREGLGKWGRFGTAIPPICTGRRRLQHQLWHRQPVDGLKTLISWRALLLTAPFRTSQSGRVRMGSSAGLKASPFRLPRPLRLLWMSPNFGPYAEGHVPR